MYFLDIVVAEVKMKYAKFPNSWQEIFTLIQMVLRYNPSIQMDYWKMKSFFVVL